MPVLVPRRQWRIQVDDRSNEIGWIIGSKVYRSRHEDGKFGGYLHYDLAVPYNEGKPLPGWSFGLPQMHKGVPFDGKLLRITPPGAEPIFVNFWYESTGVPGSLLCELINTTGDRYGKVLSEVSARTSVAGERHSERRNGGKAERRVLGEEDERREGNAG